MPQPNHGTTARSLRPAVESTVERLLLRVVDAGLVGCILVVPLLMGGRHPLGQLVLVAVAATITLAWVARACLAGQMTWRRSGAELILAAAAGLLLLQLAPLPERVLAALSPHQSELLPLWSADAPAAASPGRWCQVSLVPGATGSCLAMLLAYAMLFWVTVQRIRAVDDVERLLRWCGWAALGMAALGLAQLFAGNGKFFWFHEARFSQASDVAKGSFTNPNHFAHFLALGLGALIWWMQDPLRSGEEPRAEKLGQWSSPSRMNVPLRAVALGVVLFAVMMSRSRGGMVAVLIAAAIMIAVCYRGRVLGRRLAAAMVSVVVLVGAALAIYGLPEVGAEMGSLVSGSVESLDPGQRRRVVWSAGLDATADFAVLGTGAGSHRWVCPTYVNPEQMPGAAALADRIHFTHAENGLLQTAVETGVPGVFLLIAGVALIVYWCVGSLRRAGSRRALVAAGALSAALAVSLVQGLVDFVWHVPGCMALVAIFAAAVCRLHQLSRGPSRARQWSLAARRVWVALCMLVVIGGWMVANRVGPALAESHWRASWQLARASTIEPSGRDALRHEEREHGEAWLGQSEAVPQMAQEDAARLHQLEVSLHEIIAELEAVVRLDPTHTEARLQLAGSYLLLFEYAQQTSAANAMPLAAIREAAVASQFESRGELDAWLERAIGRHAGYLELARRHTRRALAQCPLHGAGYLYLGQLSFLEGAGSREATRRCVAQAVLVRPFDGGVLISAGQESLMAGSMTQAVDYWQRAYRLGPVCRRVLVRRLAGRACPEDPAADLALFLDVFEPELETVRQLENVYAALADDDQLAALRDRHADLAQAEAEACEDRQAACRLWMESRLAHLRRGRSGEAIACLRRAVECDPGNETARYRLAMSLLKSEQYEQAQSHLEWCVARKPSDQSLAAALRTCTKQRLKRDKTSAVADRESTQWR